MSETAGRARFPLRATVLALLLGGCAAAQYGSNAYDPVRMPSTAEIAERTQYRGYNYLRPISGYREAVGSRIAELAKSPMTEAAAVEVALLESNDVQDLMLEHWAQRSSFVAAVAERVGSPDDTRPAEWKLLGELVARSRTPRWRLEFGEEYLGTAETILDTAMHARVAYYEAVAAAQLSAMYRQTLEAEKAAAELANEQFRSGTASRLDQARAHLAYAETFKAAVKAEQDAVTKREELNRLLKLWGAQTAWSLPERLPDLPAQRPNLGDVEAYAATHSVAAYIGRADPAQFEAGAMLRSEVREAYNRMLTAYDIARHQRDTVVPLTEVALQEMQLSYNAMLEDVYELLDATREQIDAGREYVETLSEFWVASAELTQLLGGKLPATPAAMATAEAEPTPSAE
jgi:hypothetical protein